MSVATNEAITHSGVTPPLAHPTACPSWCVESGNPMDHHFGPTATVHEGQRFLLANPGPTLVEPSGILMRASLYRYDKTGEPITPTLAIHGEEECEVDAHGADVLIANVQAFLDTLRVLRRQMG
jgi:hypothetical protein